MIADFSLGRRGIDRLRELIRLLQSFGELDAAHSAVLLVAGPTASGDIAAYDALHRKHLQLSAHHTVAVELLLAEEFRHILHIYRKHMVGKNILGIVKPELGNLSKNRPLLIDLVVQNDIEAADTIGCHHDQAVPIVIDLTHFAFFDRL